MKRILTFQDGKKRYLTAQEIFDAIDTTGYDIIEYQDTWSVSNNYNGHGGSFNAIDAVDEHIVSMFIFDNLGNFELIEKIFTSSYSLSNTANALNIHIKNHADYVNQISFAAYPAGQYEPAGVSTNLAWTTVDPDNCKWILMYRKINQDSGIGRFSYINQKASSSKMLFKKLPFCQNITDLTNTSFEELYKYSQSFKLMSKDF